mgnify:FL=1|jgi:hypothetical protein
MLKEKLNKILKETDSTLLKEVVEELLDKIKDEGEEETKLYIQDVLTYGCSSGIVTSLISYTDTKKFFIKHMDEIFNILNESMQEEPRLLELDANKLAWFGYEGAISEINFMLD